MLTKPRPNNANVSGSGTLVVVAALWENGAKFINVNLTEESGDSIWYSGSFYRVQCC